MTWYFIFFFISGFCSVLYELVWLRLSMAQYGVTTAMVSIVLSVFMAGLGLGSWISGRWLRQHDEDRGISALRLYGVIELLIGISGIAVPYGLSWGAHFFEQRTLSSSFGYYVITGLWVALMLVPWCGLMGATIPVAMRAIRQTLPAEATRSFSFLYMSNVAGAVAGTTLPLLLIELLGFHATLKIGTACNCLIGLSALALSVMTPKQAVSYPNRPAVAAGGTAGGGASVLWLLFLTGLTAMAMEVVWVRRYTPFLGTVVYAFAAILAVYLPATVIGSAVYRRWFSRATAESPVLWMWLAATALLPLMLTNPHFVFSRMTRLVLGIGPFTGLLGLITPMLVDRFSGGNASKAGTAYAVNVAGCIVGPLLAGFLLLPFMSERLAVVALTLPWLMIGVVPLRPSVSPPRRRIAIYAALALAAVLIAEGRGFDEHRLNRRVLRDSTATVIATGSGMDKQLLVNGNGMTSLTTITKVMAHFPLAFLDRPPQNALVICFGMGTTFRSLRSWDIDVTAVELVPSVPRLFSYYHSDADRVLSSPKAHVVIDDGRRYLQRTSEQFDLITVDPPPPLEAAASSLLYSREFYRAAKRRLAEGGILEQWLPTTPDSEPVDVSAVARSLHDSFPYVRAFKDEFGIHFLCRDQPFPPRTAADLLRRIPEPAVRDLAEWEDDLHPVQEASKQLTTLLNQELSMDELIAASPGTPALSDDRPVNEYFAWRYWRTYHDLDIFDRD